MGRKGLFDINILHGAVTNEVLRNLTLYQTDKNIYCVKYVGVSNFTNELL